MPRRALPNRSKHTITRFGKRIPVAGGNVFPSRREALAAAALVRAEEDLGNLRVRALRPREGVLANRAKKSASGGVRRSMKNSSSAWNDPEYLALMAEYERLKAKAAELRRRRTKLKGEDRDALTARIKVTETAQFEVHRRAMALLAQLLTAP